MYAFIQGGIETFINFQAIFLTAVGVFLGIVIGVLPGIGPLLGVILMIPVIIHLSPVTGIALLIGVYVGGSCGGAISAILLRIPGTPIAAATLLDGYPLAQKGKSSLAIGLAIVASSLGGLIGGIFLVCTSPLLASVALKFGPPEYVALAITGLIAMAVVARESTIKGLLSACIGLLVAAMGTDPFTGYDRFTFGQPSLMGGIRLVALLVGLFAISEMFVQLEKGGLDRKPKIKIFKPSFKAVPVVLKNFVTLIRSSMIGTFIGAVPGTGGVASSFVSYAMAKASSSKPEEYGTGKPEGIIATEAANNACCGGALIPTMALGIPGEPITAVLLGALIILGLNPGPRLFQDSPNIVGGVFFAYLTSNVFLLFIGLLFIPLFVSILKVRTNRLIPNILLLSIVGTYAVQSSLFDVWSMWVFGLVGYVMRKFRFPLAPLVIARVLGPILEPAFRRSLIMTGGSFIIFVQRPITFGILCFDAVLLVWTSLSARHKRKIGNFIKRLLGINKKGKVSEPF